MERIGETVERELRRFAPRAGMAELVARWPAAVGPDLRVFTGLAANLTSFCFSVTSAKVALYSLSYASFAAFSDAVDVAN